MKAENAPNKDIASAICNMCFDYKPYETVLWGESIEERIYNCWQMLHYILKRSPNIIELIQETEPDEENILNK